MDRFNRKNLESTVHFHSYNKLRRFIVDNIIALIIDFSPLIALSLWIFLYIINEFNIYLFICIFLPLTFLSIYFLYLYFIKYYKIKTNTYEFKLKNIHTPVRFVFVSDLHFAYDRGGTNLKRAQILVEKINSLDTELVIFGGDFVAFDYNMDILNVLKNIKAKYKFGVYGNHDALYLKDRQHIEFPTEGLSKLEGLGIKFLNNKGHIVELNGQEFYLSGLSDLYSLNFNIDEALKDAPSDLPRILISHNPDIIEFVREEDKIDVILSGHTHGGQILLPFIGSVLPIPVKFKWLTKGLFEIYNTKLLISQGSGYGGTRIRIGTECEVCEIKLTGLDLTTNRSMIY